MKILSCQGLSFQILLALAISLQIFRCDLDPEILERQNESTLLASTLTEKLVKFYNMTEVFLERFNRFVREDPFAEGAERVDKFIIHTKELAIKYDEVAKLLQNAGTRDEGKTMFDDLYHKSTDHSDELKETLGAVDPFEVKQSNTVLDKAKQEYESLKADAEAMRTNLLDDFIDSSFVLSEHKLFPESLRVTEIDDSDRLPDVEYADALMELHRLYKKCYELELKAEDANDKDPVDAFTHGMKAQRLFYEEIPAFINKNKVALSQVVGVTADKMNILTKQFKGVDLEAAIEMGQDKVVQKVFDAYDESNKLSEARQAAGEIYHKYFERFTHEEREAQRGREKVKDEL